MESFLVSTFMVALAELGDKTQILSLALICRFHKPVPIILGIFAATVLNHAGAAYVGAWVTEKLGWDVMRWILGASFIAMAGWVLIPDKDDNIHTGQKRLGIFLTTFVAFFLAEMGDKTQLATVALAAKYQNFTWVVLGTTVGMMLANVPVIYMGKKIIARLPLPTIRRVVAVLFVILGVLVFLSGGVGV